MQRNGAKMSGVAFMGSKGNRSLVQAGSGPLFP